LSYEIYLWHFPIVILGPYLGFCPTQPWRTVLVALMTYAFAYVSHRFLESPLKSMPSSRPALFAIIGLVCSILVAIICYQVLTGDDSVQQLYKQIHDGGNSIFTNKTDNESPAAIGPEFQPNIHTNAEHSGTYGKGAIRFVLIGDSMGSQWASFLFKLDKFFPNFRIEFTLGAGCPWHYHDKNPSVRNIIFFVSGILNGFFSLHRGRNVALFFPGKKSVFFLPREKKCTFFPE